MPKRKEPKGFAKIMKRWVKPILKASTHIFTVGGVLVASAPLSLTAVVNEVKAGNFGGAGIPILRQVTGGNIVAGEPINYKQVFTTGLTVLIGIGLIMGGAQIRKRIGN